MSVSLDMINYRGSSFLLALRPCAMQSGAAISSLRFFCGLWDCMWPTIALDVVDASQNEGLSGQDFYDELLWTMFLWICLYAECIVSWRLREKHTYHTIKAQACRRFLEVLFIRQRLSGPQDLRVECRRKSGLQCSVLPEKMAWIYGMECQRPVCKCLDEASLCCRTIRDINSTVLGGSRAKPSSNCSLFGNRALFSNMEKLQVGNVIPMETKYSSWSCLSVKLQCQQGLSKRRVKLWWFQRGELKI